MRLHCYSLTHRVVTLDYKRMYTLVYVLCFDSITYLIAVTHEVQECKGAAIQVLTEPVSNQPIVLNKQAQNPTCVVRRSFQFVILRVLVRYMTRLLGLFWWDLIADR